MKCINPKMQQLIPLYNMGMLSESQELEVETHILECDSCFQEVYEFSPTKKVMAENTDLLSPALATKPSKLKKMVLEIQSYMTSLYEVVFPRRPRFVLVPLAAVMMLIIIVFRFSGSESLSGLAVIEPYLYEDLTFKGATSEPDSELKSPFEAGIELYRSGEYGQAIDQFEIQLKTEPYSSYTYLYLGISYLLSDSLDLGVEYLDDAKKLFFDYNQRKMVAVCTWYQANAYLKQDNSIEAGDLLKEIVEMDGEYREDAEKLIVKMNQVMK